MSEAAFGAAYGAVGDLVLSMPEVLAFAGWPEATYQDIAPVPIPVARSLGLWRGVSSAATEPVCAALGGIWLAAKWRQIYTEAEVGRRFLDNYGSIELVGPSGHFRAQGMRAFIAYWGPGLDYGWHLHEAEELYVILAGEALFEADGLPSAILRPGDTRLHTSNLPHRMTTQASGILTLVLWRGGGLTVPPRMGRS